MFLAGGDKAALEVELFVPGIGTAVTKRGTGRESAVHLDADESSERVRAGVAAAVTDFDALSRHDDDDEVLRVDERTVRLVAVYLDPLHV